MPIELYATLHVDVNILVYLKGHNILYRIKINIVQLDPYLLNWTNKNEVKEQVGHIIV